MGVRPTDATGVLVNLNLCDFRELDACSQFGNMLACSSEGYCQKNIARLLATQQRCRTASTSLVPGGQVCGLGGTTRCESYVSERECFGRQSHRVQHRG